MKRFYFKILLLTIPILVSCQLRNNIKQSNRSISKSNLNDTMEKSVVRLENNNVLLLINLNGGSYLNFHFKDLPINPINWHTKDTVKPAFMGHFICFDRWGPPTDAEKANGFVHHGEANTLTWKLITSPHFANGLTECSMMCSLPMGSLQLIREIELSKNEPIFFVTEEIKNLNKYGRMFNIVQHISLGPPFLDTTTLFDNNSEKGFEDKENGNLNQEDPVLNWPEAIHKGKKISLRQFQNEWPRVCSFVYDQNDRYGWVTACNPRKKLMIGYIWKSEDYPWINFWRSMENGVPVAYGMEFGTTGLHEPFPVVAKKGKIFGQNIYAFIDANEIITKSFTAFLAKIPEDYNGVEKVEIRDSLIIIKEKNRVSQDITYHIK